ncbi:MAG: class I glutamine amidotransferase-like protein, partial [Olpidium bornovanus]
LVGSRGGDYSIGQAPGLGATLYRLRLHLPPARRPEHLRSRGAHPQKQRCHGAMATLRTAGGQGRLPVKVALLLADTPPPQVVEAGGGDYGHVFARLFAAAGERRGDVEIATRAYDVVNNGEYPENFAEGFDAVLITGSGFSAYEDRPWIDRLVQYVVDVSKHHPEVKLIGVCFGHQLLARAFGGPVEKNSLGMHQDHVVDVPENFVVLSSTTITPIQAMLRKGGENASPVLTVQGHPEYTPEMVEAFLKLRLERGIYTKEFFDAAMASLRNEVDSAWFTDVIIDFVLGKL